MHILERTDTENQGSRDPAVLPGSRRRLGVLALGRGETCWLLGQQHNLTLVLQMSMA